MVIQLQNKSIWEKDIKINENQEKFQTTNTDILIIGGGITGLTTAYFLNNSKQKITLIDKSTIGMGITAKTTAKITYLQQDIYTKLKKYHGLETSKKYFESQKEAIRTITKIIKDNNINCNLEKVPSILFTTESSNIKKINDEKELLTEWNVKTKDINHKNIKTGFLVEDTYIFHPLKYLNGLRKIIEKNISIYENTIAKSIIKKDNTYVVETNNGNIITKTIVMACHYPFFLFPNLFPLRTYIEREYVNAVKVKEPKKYTAINIDKSLHSIRYYQDYLIYGSNDHKLTNKIDYERNFNQSKKDFEKYFHSKPKYTWMNQDIIPHDKLPIIGKLKDNLYISTAYNTWGMTNATIGGKIISNLINKKENTYQELFNPNRINIPLIINGFLGIFDYLKVYIESIFHKSNPHYVKIKGITYGIYEDELGKKHQIKLICPHMKCQLVFNKEELTWDCPCHGSRFDIDGNIILGPATKKVSDKN